MKTYIVILISSLTAFLMSRQTPESVTRMHPDNQIHRPYRYFLDWTVPILTSRPALFSRN
jgi:hypothetical protein